MQGGWSIGNGCDELYTEYANAGDVETNGHTLEVMNVHLEINGFIRENGEIKDVIQMITEGKVILACLESSISVHNETLSDPDYEDPDLKILAFPNPFKTHINIEAPNVKQIQIIDINGKIVFNKVTNMLRTVINLQDLQKGMYFARVYFNTIDPKTVKIIKN